MDTITILKRVWRLVSRAMRKKGVRIQAYLGPVRCAAVDASGLEGRCRQLEVGGHLVI